MGDADWDAELQKLRMRHVLQRGVVFPVGASFFKPWAVAGRTIYTFFGFAAVHGRSVCTFSTQGAGVTPGTLFRLEILGRNTLVFGGLLPGTLFETQVPNLSYLGGPYLWVYFSILLIISGNPSLA